MTLINTATATANGRTVIKLKNHGTGKPDRIAYAVAGTFGSGTVAVQLSTDGTTWIDNIPDAVTFTAAEFGTLDYQSDEQEPLYLGFNLTGSTSPELIIKVYDNT